MRVLCDFSLRKKEKFLLTISNYYAIMLYCKVNTRKEGSACWEPISPKSFIGKRSTASGRECPTATDARYWLAGEQRAGKSCLTEIEATWMWSFFLLRHDCRNGAKGTGFAYYGRDGRMKESFTLKENRDFRRLYNRGKSYVSPVVVTYICKIGTRMSGTALPPVRK